MAVSVQKKMFNVAEYEQMGLSGILAEDDRVELIEGEIIEMSPIGERHAACVKRLIDLFLQLQSQKAVVMSVQDPIHLDEYSEPQPDFALVKPRVDFYEKQKPGPNDVFLIVEVADSSLDYDRALKIPLYARHGIPEVWLLNLLNNSIDVHRNPSSTGYSVTETYLSGQSLSSTAFPEFMVEVKDLLG